MARVDLIERDGERSGPSDGGGRIERMRIYIPSTDRYPNEAKMIVNDLAAKKTVDEESGEFLTFRTIDPREHLMHFEVHDQDGRSRFGAVVERNARFEGELFRITYSVRQLLKVDPSSPVPVEISGGQQQLARLLEFLQVFRQYFGLPVDGAVCVDVVDGRDSRVEDQ